MTRRPRQLGTFLGFVIAGGTATVVNYGVFLVLYWAGMLYLVASAIGYVSGIALSFAINRVLVFRSSGNTRTEALRYTLAYGVALMAQLLLLEVFVRAGLDPVVANAIALIIVVIGNFFVIRRFVFSSTDTR